MTIVIASHATYFRALKGHDGQAWNDQVQVVETPALRLKETEALVSPIR
jgi:hypothetical protein